MLTQSRILLSLCPMGLPVMFDRSPGVIPSHLFRISVGSISFLYCSLNQSALRVVPRLLFFCCEAGVDAGIGSRRSSMSGSTVVFSRSLQSRKSCGVAKISSTSSFNSLITTICLMLRMERRNSILACMSRFSNAGTANNTDELKSKVGYGACSC